MDVSNKVQYDQEFKRIFREEYYDIMINYINIMQKTIEKYDVVIFMARKAYCLYLSLCKAGIIDENKNCKVLSSRALTYCNLNLNNKKTAIIEDVVIQGIALTDILSESVLTNKRIDIYIVACTEIFPKSFYDKTGYNIQNAFATLTEKQLLELASLITNFIVNKLTPYNIDNPVFEFTYEDDKQLNIMHRNNFTLISDLISDSKKIEEGIIHLNNNTLHEYIPNTTLNNTIIKIRIYNDISNKKCLIVPIIIFPELDHNTLIEIFNNVFKPDIYDIYHEQIDNDINVFKLITYALSYIIGSSYLDTEKINNYNLNVPEEAIFNAKITNHIIAKQNNSVIVSDNVIDNFELYKHLACAYDILLKKDSQEDDCEYITYNDIFEFIYNTEEKPKDDLKLYASIILDIFIDNGIVVPRLQKRGIITIKRYKFGEVAQLTINDYQAFSKMLSEYSIAEDRAMDSIEVEKLSVIFFRQYNHKFVSCNNNLETYRICYSKFGPRLSTNEQSHYVTKYKTLTEHLIDNFLLIKSSEGYVVPLEITIQEDHLTNEECIAFAITYNTIHELYNRIKLNDTHNKALKYINSYNRLLTLLSIGSDEKSCITSLIAEIYLIYKKKFDTYFSNSKSSIQILGTIIDGVLSGIWKYFCYINPDIRKDLCSFFQDTNTLRAEKLVFLSETKNISYKKILNESYFDKISQLLFDTALFYYYSSKRLGLEVHNDFNSSPYKYLLFEKSDSDLYKIHSNYDIISKMDANDFELYVKEKFSEISIQASEILDEYKLYDAASTLSYYSSTMCFVLFDFDDIELSDINNVFYYYKDLIIFPLENEHYKKTILDELCNRLFNKKGKILFYESHNSNIKLKYVPHYYYGEKFLNNLNEHISNVKNLNYPHIRGFVNILPNNEKLEDCLDSKYFKFNLIQTDNSSNSNFKYDYYDFTKEDSSMEINGITIIGGQQTFAEQASINNFFSLDNENDANKLVKELTRLKEFANNDEMKDNIELAINSISKKDESKFKQALSWLKNNALSLIEHAAVPIILNLINQQ